MSRMGGIESFVEHVVEADGFTIRYAEAGEGAPVVWFHGAGGLRLSHGLAGIAERHRVAAFELPGFGTSALNERTQSAREMAATMAEALTAVGIERCTLVGTSMGGVVACWFAVDHGDRLDALVLEAPAAFRPDGPPLTDRTPEDIHRAMFVHPERLPERAPPDPAVMERNWPLVMRLMGPAHDDELAAGIQQVTVPTLILFGTRDGIFPPEQGRIYKRLLPNSFFQYVFDAAHQIQHDRPEAFAAVVTEFAERHGAFLAVRDSSMLHR